MIKHQYDANTTALLFLRGQKKFGSFLGGSFDLEFRGANAFAESYLTLLYSSVPTTMPFINATHNLWPYIFDLDKYSSQPD